MSQQKGKRKKRLEGATLRKIRARGVARRDVAGRVHLVLHKNAQGDGVAVSLKAPIFAEAWQNELTASAASTAHAALKAGLSNERVVRLARHMMDSTSELADGLLARAQGKKVACSAGCDHCCYQSVGVTAPEALAIVDYLTRELSPEALTAFKQHIAKAHKATDGLSFSERYSPSYPCPFLVSSRCSIYDVRPLSCRGMNSLDAAECSDNLRQPSARAAFLESGSGGQSFMEPIRAFHAISAGLQLGLSELYHLDMRPLNLTAAIHLLLSDAQNLPEQWLSGLSPLKAALGGDSSQSRSARELSGALALGREPAD